MDDDRKDNAVAKNGFSSELSSPKSSSSNETSVSNLLSSSGYQQLDDSMTKSAQSKSSHPSSSVLSDLTPDSSKASETIQVASDYSGTRFVVKRTESSELQSPVQSSSNSSSRVERASSQSPKSVKFIVEESEAGPSRGKSPQKSPSLTKSVTSNALVKLLEFEPRKLFSQKSQDSFPSKEEIELPSINSGKDLSPNHDVSDDDNDLSDKEQEPSDPETPLLSCTDSQPISTIDIHGPGGVVATLPVEEIANTPELPTSEATTASGERHCQQQMMGGFVCYISVMMFIACFIGIGWWAIVHYGFPSRSTSNDTLISANETENSTMKFALDALNRNQTRQEFDKLLFTVPETTTDAFTTDAITTDTFTTDAFTTDMATDVQNIDNPTTTTNTPYLNVLTTDASTTAETTTYHND